MDREVPFDFERFLVKHKIRCSSLRIAAYLLFHQKNFIRHNWWLWWHWGSADNSWDKSLLRFTSYTPFISRFPQKLSISFSHFIDKRHLILLYIWFIRHLKWWMDWSFRVVDELISFNRLGHYFSSARKGRSYLAR